MRWGTLDRRPEDVSSGPPRFDLVYGRARSTRPRRHPRTQRPRLSDRRSDACFRDRRRCAPRLLRAAGAGRLPASALPRTRPPGPVAGATAMATEYALARPPARECSWAIAAPLSAVVVATTASLPTQGLGTGWAPPFSDSSKGRTRSATPPANALSRSVCGLLLARQSQKCAVGPRVGVYDSCIFALRHTSARLVRVISVLGCSGPSTRSLSASNCLRSRIARPRSPAEW